MPKFYCDYCDVDLTHDSYNGRRQHNYGWKHRENVKAYYAKYVIQAREEAMMQSYGGFYGRPPPPHMMPPRPMMVRPHMPPPSTNFAPPGVMHARPPPRGMPPRPTSSNTFPRGPPGVPSGAPPRGIRSVSPIPSLPMPVPPS